MKFYLVRNQYGITLRFKIFNRSFRVLKVSNNVYNNSNLDNFLSTRSFGIIDRSTLSSALRLISKRFEVIEYGMGEIIVVMPFAKDVERKLKNHLIVGARPVFLEPVSLSHILTLRGEWKNNYGK